MTNTMNVAPTVDQIVAVALDLSTNPFVRPVDVAAIESLLEVMPNSFAADGLVAIGRRYGRL